MSGGYFNYEQFKLTDIAYKIDELIKTNNEVNEWNQARNYSEDTLEAFRIGSSLLKLAFVYVHRIDYLVCGDTGEETFMDRLEIEVDKLEEQLEQERNQK